MSEATPAAEKRYVILELSDAKALARLARATLKDAPPSHLPVITRIEDETGADIADIVRQLKSLELCHACVVESQEEYCVCWRGQKLGRRLSRLVDRAHGIVSTPPDADDSEAPPALQEPRGGAPVYVEPTRADVEADDTERRLQMQAATALLEEVDSVMGKVHQRAMNAALHDELYRDIDAKLDAWRAQYPNVLAFQSKAYSFVVEMDAEKNRVNVFPSPAIAALAEGRSRVRLTPLV